MTLSAIVSCFAIASCSESDTIPEEETNNQGGDSIIVPTLDWGASISEVKSKQNKELNLQTSTDNLLRYVNDTQNVTVDYSFSDDKLTGVSLTHAKLLSINEVAENWLKDYDELAKSETAILSVSNNNASLAYGKILKGSENDYTVIAWTYIDGNEDVDDGPDFSPTGTIDGHDYVDLGVGVGWAVKNVGASSPEEYGGYYMWGETVTRSYCFWTRYSLYRGDVNGFLDYDKFYTPYSNISGTNYDAAKVKMGEKWRMPTRAEFYTLINNCDFTVGEYNGVSGFIVTGPSGKSIFLPAEGLKDRDEVKWTNTVYLWSSTTYGKQDAYYLEYMTKNLKDSGIRTIGKYKGMPIRGIVDLE